MFKFSSKTTPYSTDSFSMLDSLHQYVGIHKERFVIAMDVFNWLNQEALASIEVDGDNYWFEWNNVNYQAYPSKRVMRYIQRFIERQGYKYLENIV